MVSPEKNVSQKRRELSSYVYYPSINFLLSNKKKRYAVGRGRGRAVDLEGQCEISKPTALSCSLSLVAANPMFMIFLNSLFRVLFSKPSGLNVLAFWAIFLSKSAMLRLKLVCNKKNRMCLKLLVFIINCGRSKLKVRGGGGVTIPLSLSRRVLTQML